MKKIISFPVLWALACLVIVFSLPRFLISIYGPAHPLTSYIYMYGFGGLFFITGVILIKKSGAYNPKLKSDQKWFRSLILGYFYFLSLHGIWIYLSLNVPTLYN